MIYLIYPFFKLHYKYNTDYTFVTWLKQGPTWNGRSGVHSHMTNTRITDPEILERR